jgi:glycine oxidase
MPKKYDFVIVGQGIAGTVLSYTLLKRGYDVLVVDNAAEVSSSKVAAGLYNPITGKRMTKSWKADELLAFAIPFYKEFEKRFSVEILYEKPLYRVFSSIEEQNQWAAKSAYPEYEGLEISFENLVSCRCFE